MSFYLAIDIGTSSTKAGLFDEAGRLVLSRSLGYPVAYPRPGWAEQDPEDWWKAVQALCQDLMQAAGHPILRAVCVSGQAPLCVPVDANGGALRPAILWLDRRSHPQVAWLQERLGAAGITPQDGNRLDSYFGGLKWLWYRQNEAELYRKTWKIVQANGYIHYKLAGEIAIDPSHAGLCSPCFDLKTRGWDEAVCALMELDIDKLPVIRQPAEIIGEVSQSAAALTGLHAGTPVVCGGADFACACLGAGVVNPGVAAMMLGTAGNLLVPSPKHADRRLLNTIHLTGDPLSLGGVLAGGAVQWFGEMLENPQTDLFAVLDAEAAQAPPGGPVFLPYLLGERTPIWDPRARGVFFGLSMEHRRGHLFRAVLEGVAYAFRQVADIFAEMGSPLREVIAINGGARSAVWRQIFADVLGLPVRWRPDNLGTVLGAALLAAKATGQEQDIHDWLGQTVDVFPNPEKADIYRDQYRIFTRLYGRLQDCFPT